MYSFEYYTIKQEPSEQRNYLHLGIYVKKVLSCPNQRFFLGRMELFSLYAQHAPLPWAAGSLYFVYAQQMIISNKTPLQQRMNAAVPALVGGDAIRQIAGIHHVMGAKEAAGF